MADDEQSAWRWVETVWVAGLGVVQISAGIYLQTSSAGLLSHVAVLLIRQGSSDIAFAVRTGVTGTFSWREYIWDKLIGLPLSVISIGAERWLPGSRVGPWIIDEVSSDIVSAVRTGVAGNWRKYLCQKLIGLPTSLFLDRRVRPLFGSAIDEGSILRRIAATARFAGLRGAVNVLIRKAINYLFGVEATVENSQ